MLIKAVPYYPVLMRKAHRVSHHFNVASNKSYAVATTKCGCSNKV